MIMLFIELLLAATATAVVGMYVCRLGDLLIGRHRCSFILLHIGLGAGAAAAGVHAWQGEMDLQDMSGLVASAGWLWISWTTWKQGPPDHVLRDPHTFDRMVTLMKLWAHIHRP